MGKATGGWVDVPFIDRDASFPQTVAWWLHAVYEVIRPDAHALATGTSL